MLTKILGLSTTSGLIYIYILSQLQTNNALFLVASNNATINLSILLIVIAATRLSYITKINSTNLYLSLVVAAASLTIFGIFGLTYSIFRSYDGYIQPLDYLMIAEAGTILAIDSLTIKHQPIKLVYRRINFAPRLRLPAIPQIKHAYTIK